VKPQVVVVLNGLKCGCQWVYIRLTARVIRPYALTIIQTKHMLCQDSSHKILGGRENLTKLDGKELPGRQGYTLKRNIVVQ